MAGYVILGALAAFGLLSLLWTAFGWLLPAGKGCAMVCWGWPDEGIAARYRWLRGIGLFSGPLIALEREANVCHSCRDIEICSPEALILRLKWERNRFDGTGNGDSSGHRQRGGVPKL